MLYFSFKQRIIISFVIFSFLYLWNIGLKTILLMDMLSTGERIIQLRKAKKWSQEDLAKQVNSSRIMIGNYERGDNTPSVDVISKIASAFDVSVDYLLGKGINASFDKETVRRIHEIEKLPEAERQRIFQYMDLIIRDYKAKKAYS